MRKQLNPLYWIALGLVYVYRYLGSPFFGYHCRFQPTCSVYAIDALKSKPLMIACVLIVKRIAKCRPGGDSGCDPVE